MPSSDEFLREAENGEPHLTTPDHEPVIFRHGHPYESKILHASHDGMGRGSLWVLIFEEAW